MTSSVFAKYQPQAWPITFRGVLTARTICGGTPSDPNVAEGFIRSKLDTTDNLIMRAVAEMMAERGISADEAATEVDRLRHLNGFKRDPERGGELYIEGRQLKAAIKEAACVAAATGKVPLRTWGQTKKGLVKFIAEHVQVVEDCLYLGVKEPSGVNQRFVQTYHGSAIQYEEYVTEARIEFTVITDYEFTREQWAMIWLTGEQQGIGATRSQGFGRYVVTRWERTS